MNTKLPLLIVAVFIFSSMLYYQSLYSKRINSPSPAPSFYIAPSPLTTYLNTSDWITYTNKKNKFSFKYPRDWKVVNDAGDSLRIWPPEVVENMKSFQGGGGGSFLTNLVRIESSDEAIRTLKFLTDNTDKYIVTKDILLDGEPATIYYSIFKVEPYGASLGEYYVEVAQIINGEDKLFTLRLWIPPTQNLYNSFCSVTD
jgi:hypothetical protein